MNISKKDKQEISGITDLIIKVDNIDEDYINSEANLISDKQPFLISLLLGYRIDLKESELENVMRIILLIWEFFKDNKHGHHIKITENLFNKIQKRNFHMLKYLDGEDGKEEQSFIVASDLSHLKSKALLTGIFHQFNNKDSLKKMDKKKRGVIIIGMKSLIECFETINEQ